MNTTIGKKPGCIAKGYDKLIQEYKDVYQNSR